MFSLLFATSLILVPADELTSPSNYQYYFGDFITHAMSVEEPLAKLISRRLAESFLRPRRTTFS